MKKDSILLNSDHENDSTSPDFDVFYASTGSKGIYKMCHFDAEEFKVLWNACSDRVWEFHNLGSCRKFDGNGMNVSFMTLVMLKSGTQ